MCHLLSFDWLPHLLSSEHFQANYGPYPKPKLKKSGNITKFPEVLEFIRTNLSTEYTIHELKTQVWRYGDVNNRERWVLVGFLNNMGVHAQGFEFPEPIFDESSVDFPKARDCAVPDECVPAVY